MKLIQLFSGTLLFTLSFYSVSAHEKNESGKDLLLKETIYNAERAKVLDFSSKSLTHYFLNIWIKNPALV